MSRGVGYFFSQRHPKKKNNIVEHRHVHGLVSNVTNHFGALWPVGFRIERGRDVLVTNGGDGAGQFLDGVPRFADMNAEQFLEGSFFHAIDFGFPGDARSGIDVVHQLEFLGGESQCCEYFSSHCY